MGVSQYTYEQQKILVKNLRIKLKEQNKVRERMERRGVFPNCKDCKGHGEVPVGNVRGIYGWVSRAGGYTYCKTCRGTGYIKKKKMKKSFFRI